MSAQKASKVRMSLLALLALVLTAPASTAQFMGKNAAIYAPTVTPGVASLNWAGYALSGASYSNVQGHWTQPAATCTSGQSSMSGFWVGLGGFSASATGVEQIGTASNCDGKASPSYFAWYELFPAPAVTLPINVQPGDSVDAQVTSSDGSYTFTLTTSSGGTFTTTQTPAVPGDNSSAEWIAEAPATCNPQMHCKVLPLTNFGGITYSGADATPFDGGLTPIAMVTKTLTFKALPGRFQGSSFSVHWLHK